MVALTLRLVQETALRLRLVAAIEGRTQSDIIRQAIEEYLVTHGAVSLESLETTLR